MFGENLDSARLDSKYLCDTWFTPSTLQKMQNQVWWHYSPYNNTWLDIPLTRAFPLLKPARTASEQPEDPERLTPIPFGNIRTS